MSFTDDTVLILGGDGYTGFPLSLLLYRLGASIVIGDNWFRRETVSSVTPIASPTWRMIAARETYGGGTYYSVPIDTRDYEDLREFIRYVDPDHIVNLAQIPSAPYSMKGPVEAWEVQESNVRGSLNLLWALRELGKVDTHVVQLATMGEYGTPEEGIPEGFLPDGRPAPKDPGSFYHASKVQATTNTLFASRTWGIPVTEVYQGIVYGLRPFPRRIGGGSVEDERLLTRFDVDEAFGTVINRFTAQAVSGMNLTVYGEGRQKRAILPLRECVDCLTRLLENPPHPDRAGGYPYRAVNQFGEAWRIDELAELIAYHSGIQQSIGIDHLPNPREEDDSEHSYDPEREVLDDLGYNPSTRLAEEVQATAAILRDYKDRLPTDYRPTTEWNP